MESNKDEKKIKSGLDEFLGDTESKNADCPDGVCIIKGDKSLVERINKKIMTEDGRQLL